MNSEINNFFIIILVCYSLVHIFQFFQKQKSWQEVVIPVALPLIMLLLLTEIEQLATYNTVGLAHLLVITLVLIAAMIIILVLLRSRHIMITSFFLAVLIYVTLVSTMIPSSDVTTDPNVELFVVEQSR